MKKKIIFAMLGMILLLGMGIAYTILDNGDVIFSTSEARKLKNVDIENYMDQLITETSFEIQSDNVMVYYNISYLEPLQDTDNSYRLFKQEKGFRITRTIYDACVLQNSAPFCKEALADGTSTYYYNVDGENVSISSTYDLAVKEQMEQIVKSKLFRDFA